MSQTAKFSVTLCFLLILAACSPSPDSLALEPTEITQEVPTPNEVVGPDRYFNDQGSFSLVLPEGWEVAGPIDASGGDGLSFSLYRLGVNPEASGGPGISSIAISDSDAITIEDFVQGQCSTCPLAPIQEIQLGDVLAHRTIVGGAGVPIEVTWTFIEHDSKLIALAIHDPETLEPLNDVVESVRLR